MNKPSMGRIVHYSNEQGVVCPAIITGVFQDVGSIRLTLFEGEKTTPNVDASYRCAAGPKEAVAGAWWWPERL